MKRYINKKIFFLLGIIFVALLCSLTSSSKEISAIANDHNKDTMYTRKGTGPMYFSTYEYQHTKNTYMPEERFKKNIDWIAENFLPYGYNMVATDGWIEGATLLNKNGYILSHNDEWITNPINLDVQTEINQSQENKLLEADDDLFQYATDEYPNGHTWKYWSDYLQSKGMKLGIYYNPLWISPEVVEHPDKYIVKGTENNPGGPTYVVDLIDQGDPADPIDGDRFNGGQGNSRALYWVNVNHPDAEKYIKGYVDYFKDQGAEYLRVDFLSWYETGTDINLGDVGIAHGRDSYEKCLRWMSEAAKRDNIFLSLVMPHLMNHGELEMQYGDMIRINEDVFDGGWNHISERRQEWQPVWSQWANSFQGFTGFSDISGRTNIIMDGDFLRMNSFQGNNAENEKKSAVSLYFLTGSPIAIADQFDTIGDNYKYYQNTELIELNKTGLVCKPVYESAEFYGDNNDSRDSERWIGQLPDGTWIVGLFNRKFKVQTFDIDFVKELGFEQGLVRNLWEHEDTGIHENISVKIKPHDCMIFKIVPMTDGTIMQAEVASYTYGVEFSKSEAEYSGYGYLTAMNKEGKSATFAFNAPNNGTYKLVLNYLTKQRSEANITIRDVENGITKYTNKVTLNNSNNKWKPTNLDIELQEGINLITVEYLKGDFSLDSVEIKNSTQNRTALIRNEDFNGIESWSFSNMVNLIALNDNLQINEVKAQPYISDVWQYIVPKKGVYTLTANIWLSGSYSNAFLYVENGDTILTKELLQSDNYTKIEIPNIKITKKSVIKIGVKSIGNIGSKMSIDNIKLSKNNKEFIFLNIKLLYFVLCITLLLISTLLIIKTINCVVKKRKKNNIFLR